MKKTNKNTTLTPEQYIRQKARTLPIGQCYMNKNWFISGIAIAVVCRCHKKDTYTFGVFQLDTFCTGLIECKVEFSRDQESYNNIIAYLKNSFKIEPVTYQEVHNLIFGGVAFGEDAGFTPPNDFNLAKYLLEEDTEDIPLINYQFGRYGKHFLLADSEQELDQFMPHLIAHLGKENILFGIEGSDRYFRGEDFYDSKTREAMRQIASKIRQQKQTPIEEYSYVHPAYPTELNVKHAVLKDMLYDPDNRLRLSDVQIKQILDLPHDEVKEDLEKIMLFETGQTCDVIPDTDLNEKNSVLVHCLILLGELGYKESLPTVLETLCQKKEFYDYHFGIILNEIYVPTLYKLGKDSLDKFFEYLQTPGLYTYARYLIFPAIVQIVDHEPERRMEVIEWLRNVLNFYAENLAENKCCDGSLIGLIITDILKLQAEELLPEVKELYATGKVNEQCCGNYDNVVAMMKNQKPFTINYKFDIHERYTELRNGYEQIVNAHNNIIEEAKQAKLSQEEANKQDADKEEDIDKTAVTASDIKEAETVEEIPAKAVSTEVMESETTLKETEPKAPAKKKTTKKSSVKQTSTDETTEVNTAEKKPKATRCKKATATKKSKETEASTEASVKTKKVSKTTKTVKGSDVKEKKPRATKAKAKTETKAE